MYTKSEAIALMNKWGSNRRPFLFILDFEGAKNYIYTLDNVPADIKFKLSTSNNVQESSNSQFLFEPQPVSFETYKRSFQKVIGELKYGNSYLINLTFPSNLITDLDLATIYQQSTAQYKLLFKDEFVVFSPECFIKILDQKIYSYPMKGTIDATLPEADQQLLNSPKEAAEHATIVDLIRNDLNQIAENVRVEKYRYVDKIETFNGPLLQVSSEIVGDLDAKFNEQLGSMIFSLLPAGSISGAPKMKTVEIIKDSEIMDRGFFTGVFGVFDGTNLDSGVMIRYIEKNKEKLIFKSGGGITSQSDPQAEYNEMIQKVYVPII